MNSNVTDFIDAVSIKDRMKSTVIKVVGVFYQKDISSFEESQSLIDVKLNEFGMRLESNEYPVDCILFLKSLKDSNDFESFINYFVIITGLFILIKDQADKSVTDSAFDIINEFYESL